ncbi:MAG: hypothetical protein ABWX92_07325 [Mycetocola sp.]
MVQITPVSETGAPLIEFDIVGVGKFHLPVLGQPGTPFGVTSAFGLFQNAKNGGDAAKLAAWSQLISTLSDTFPDAVRVMSRLDSADIMAVFTAWGSESKGYDPKA